MTLTAGATNIQTQKNEAQKLEQEKNALASEQKSLEARVQELDASMARAQEQIDAKRAEIEVAEQELVQAKMDENDQYESMRVRIRYMYENGNVNIFQVFMDSDSIADFFNKTEYIRTMSEYDRKKLNEFQMTLRAVEEKELALRAEYDNLAELQLSIAAQSAEAERLLSEKSSELSKLSNKLSSLKKQIKNAEEEERRRKEQEEAEKENSTSGNSGGSSSGSSSGSSTQAKPPVVSGNGYFTHPCPGMTRVSSTFSEVREGVNDPNPHKGIDYAAPRGTPIYAAAAGTVIHAFRSTSAGWWVVINHGNGLETQYMHMYAKPLVSEGQRVQKGQHIGGVGNTGNSFGNHLHFQVELYGKPVNPMKYL